MASQDLEKLNPGDMLKEADLGSYISAMGLGVAEAQKALDDNSIAQLVVLSQPVEALKGKSLIQLGLLPAFYHFRKATLSASINVSLKVSESLSVGGSLDIKSDGKVDKTKTSSSSQKQVIAHTLTVNDSISIMNSAASNDSAIKKIGGYTQHLSSGKTVISSRAELAGAAAYSTNGLVGWSSAGALFAVPPAGQGWQVWKFSGGISNSNSFAVKSTTGWTGVAQTDAATAADWLKLKAESANLWAYAFPGKFKVGFDFAKDIIRIEDEPKLRVLANLIANAGLANVKLTGRTDKVGQEGANVKLGIRRAEAVKQLLIGFGASATSVTYNLISDGESQAALAETIDDSARAPDRHVEIEIDPAAWFVLIAGSGVISSGTTEALANATKGLVAKGTYPDNGKKALTDGAVTRAADLAAQFDNHASYEASHESESEVVYLSNNEDIGVDVFDLEIWKEDNTAFAITSISSSAEVTQDVLTTEETNNLVKKKNRTTAFALSIDARYARSYDLSMTGSMSVSAELASVPPPQEFIEFIRKTWEE